MSVRLVIDMNLSHEWCDVFAEIGWFAVHWSEVGSQSAEDQEIMTWARDNNCIVFTHDLDFGTLLALTHAAGPSVLQVRSRKILPRHISVKTISVIRQYETELSSGAIVVIDDSKSRVRILPI